jgi:hypothetical protein
VAETPDKETQRDKPPEAAQQGASSRVPAIVVSLSALAVIGAATANSLPNFNGFSLPNFDHFSLPNFNRLPNSTQDGFSPDTGSRRQRDAEGYSVVAAAKRCCVGVDHAEHRNSTGGFERNIPSTLLASGAGGRSAECGDAVDDFQHLTFKYPRKYPRSGRPDVAKNSLSKNSLATA